MSIKRDQADTEFSKVVRLRDKHCQHCGKGGALECAHIHGRRTKSVRWSLDNAIALCHACHRHFTENPLDFAGWCSSQLGDGHLEILLEKKQAIFKTTKEIRKEIAKHYREERKRLEQDPDYSPISYN